MASRRPLTFILLGLLICVGCKKPAPTPTPPPTLQSTMFNPTEEQPRLPSIRVWLGDQELITEIARSPVQVQTGMMFREVMRTNEAMIFVFADANYRSFYMRNTRIPLSCAYIDPSGTVLEIYDMKPLDETPIPSKSDNIQYVLEVNQGWFAQHKIGPGTSLRTELGTLADTFFSRPKP